MAHGGTNFGNIIWVSLNNEIGFWAGANEGGDLQVAVYGADITSYDYDAAINEAG